VYLWLRLVRCLIVASAGRPLALPDAVSQLSFRVWPHDLDLSGHMNNGRYLMLMDLGRLDIIARSGLLRPAWRNGWTPIASGIQIRFRRELRLWQRVRLETRLVAWQAQHVVMEQRFVITSGPHAGHLAALALFKGGLYDRAARRFVAMERLMAEIGLSAPSPQPTPDVAAFLAADEALQQARRGT